MTLFHDTPLRPIRRLLIANRGEIALRILRACRDEGISPIAVYADPDRDALFVRAADEAHALQGSSPAETYLHIDKLIGMARSSGADAVHPGYGFLSENAAFARTVQEAGLIWIGPDPSVIDRLGDKLAARALAQSVGAPLAAGSLGPVTAIEARAFAETHGLPVILKAAHGGGGRGMKVVWRLEELDDLHASATREAQLAFGRSEVFVEQFLTRPRHIEAQVLADQHGTVKVLGTRDCSLQRRNQKLVEEAPAPFLPPEMRARIHRAAQAICAKAGYSGAGTVEFLLSANGTLSFLEVNTRLQVEHPVTEETTGMDLVRAMIRVAQGARLMDDHTPEPRGHSIEFRINAEDPGRGFLPTPGPITRLDPPSGPGIRLDSGVASGCIVPGDYDSLMAKLIVTGATRTEALQRAARALAEFRIEGVASTLPFHRAAITHPDFAGEFKVHTGWIETEGPQIAPAPRVTPASAAPLIRLAIELDGKRHELGLPPGLLTAAPVAAPPEPEPDGITAPVSGRLTLWLVDDDAAVLPGDAIAVMEAMKMETRIEAPVAGRITRLAEAGTVLAQGAALARIG